MRKGTLMPIELVVNKAHVGTLLANKTLSLLEGTERRKDRWGKMEGCRGERINGVPFI
jgi:hypothetical protein